MTLETSSLSVMKVKISLTIEVFHVRIGCFHSKCSGILCIRNMYFYVTKKLIPRCANDIEKKLRSTKYYVFRCIKSYIKMKNYLGN